MEIHLFLKWLLGMRLLGRWMVICSVVWSGMVLGQTDPLNCTHGVKVGTQMLFKTGNFSVTHMKGTDANFNAGSPWSVYSGNIVDFWGGAKVKNITSIVITTSNAGSALAAVGGTIKVLSGAGTVSTSVTESVATIKVSGVGVKEIQVQPSALSNWVSLVIHYDAVPEGPNMEVSVGALDGFGYVVGDGPSKVQTFVVSGTGLSGDVILQASSNFQISPTAGVYGDNWYLYPKNGVLVATTIYVRMKSGLKVNSSYTGNVVFTSKGAADVRVDFSGSVDPLPVAPVIALPEIQIGTVGAAYDYQISASGNPTTYTVSGGMPTGISLNGNTGKISGTPTAVGSYSATITATNLGGTSVPAPIAFTIGKGIQTAVLPDLNATLGGGVVTLPTQTAQGIPLVYRTGNSAVATLAGNVLTIEGLGTTTIHAESSENNNYDLFEDSFALNVTAPTGPCGVESFNNLELKSSYASGSFVGEKGIVWTYVASRNENGDANGSGIDGSAIMLRRKSDGSAIQSSSISSGIGDFSVKLYKGFTAVGPREVELYVNGVLKGVSDPFDDYEAHLFEVKGIDLKGGFNIEIRNSKSTQVIVDDITWSCYSGTPPLGSSDVVKSQLRIYNKDQVVYVKASSRIEDIEVYNFNGQVIGSVSGAHSESASLPVSDKGFAVVRVLLENGEVVVKKVVLK